MKPNEIHFNQAISSINVSDHYEELCMNMIRGFAKNTLLQLTQMDLYLDVMELYGYLRQGDYSKMLFDKIDKAATLYEEVNNDPEFKENRLKLIEVAKSYTEKITQLANIEKELK